MNAYRDPRQLKQLLIFLEYKRTQRKSVEIYKTAQSLFCSAFARASEDIPQSYSDQNWPGLISAIARATLAAAHLYVDSRPTAIEFCDFLLWEAEFQLPPDDDQLFHDCLDVYLQSQSESDVIDLISRLWKR